MAANKIYIQVDFSADGAQGAINELNKKLESIGDSTKKATASATVGIEGFSQALFRALLGVNLASDSITTAARALADFAKSAVQSAALFEQLEASNRTLATSVGISSTAMAGLKARLAELNIMGIKADQAINKGLLEGITNTDTLQKIGQWSKLISQANGSDVVENYEKFSQALASGNTRQLRSLNLIVNITKAEDLREANLQRNLNQRERSEYRVLLVQQEIDRVTKAGLPTTDTLIQKTKDLTDAWENFKIAVANPLLKPLTELFKSLADELNKEVIPYLKATGEEFKTIAEYYERFARALELINTLPQIATKGLIDRSPLTQRVEDLKTYRNLLGTFGELTDRYINPPVPSPPKPPPAPVLTEKDKTEKEELTADEINALHHKATEDILRTREQFTKAQKESINLQITLLKESATASEKMARSSEDAATASQQGLQLWIDVEKQRRLTISQIRAEGEEEKRLLAIRVDKFGKIQAVPVAPEAIANINRRVREQEQTANKKFDSELFEDFRAIAEARSKIVQELINRLWIEPAKAAIELWDRLREDSERLADEVARNQSAGVEQRTQLALAGLDRIEAVTLDQALAVEKQRTAITIQGIEERNALDLKQQDIETAREIEKARTALIIEGKYNAESFKQEEQKLKDIGDARKEGLKQAADTSVRDAQIRANAEAQRAILAQDRETFDKIKDFTGQLFDAFTDKSTSMFKAIADVFKKTFISAFKDIVTSQFAIALYGLLGYGKAYANGPGQPVSFTGQQAVTPVGYGRSILDTLFGRPAPAIPGGVPVSDSTIVNYGGGPTASVGGGSVGALMNALSGGGDGTTGFRSRMMTDATSGYVNYSSLPYQSASGAYTAQSPASAWGMANARSTLGSASYTPTQLSRIRESLNIGQPIRTAAGTTVSWSAASPAQKLGSVMRSPGFQSLAATVGVTAALAGLQRGGVLGNAMTIGGFALAGSQLGHFIGMPGPAGALLGAGVGLVASGVQRGGAVGLGMDIAGGALAGSMIGGRFAGPLGFAVGAVVGGAIGAGIGVARLFYKTTDEKIRAAIKQVYGIDIPDASIRKQIADIAKQSYGGNIDIAVRSEEVQNIVRLYSLSTGQQANLPRPMYGATIAQSGAGGMQTQPVYSNGQLVANPYSGVTTSQWQQAGLYVQLNPAQANALFEGRVVQVVQNNPAAVASATTSGAASGDSRTALRSALMDPLTVTR